MKEIRSYEKDNEYELRVAQKQRMEEAVAAWKMRYYIELLRLNSMRHIVDVVEAKNQEMAEDMRTMEHRMADIQARSEEMEAAVGSFKGEAGTLERDKSALAQQLKETQQLLKQTQEALQEREEELAAEKAARAAQQDMFKQQTEQVGIVDEQLQITRLTCQDLVKTIAARDGELAHTKQQLQQTTEQLESVTAAAAAERAGLHCDIESARMGREDTEMRFLMVSKLHDVLGDKEDEIKRCQSEMQRAVLKMASLQGELGKEQQEHAATQEAKKAVERERSGLHQLLSDVAIKLSSAEEQLAVEVEARQQLEQQVAEQLQELADQAEAIEEMTEHDGNQKSEIDDLLWELNENRMQFEYMNMEIENGRGRVMVQRLQLERATHYSRFLKRSCSTHAS